MTPEQLADENASIQKNAWQVTNTVLLPVPQPPPVPHPHPKYAEPAYAPVQSNSDAQYSQPGWSWGGFCFSLLFAIAIRRYVYLWFLLGMVLPPINFVVVIGLMIYFGMKGRELAAESKIFTSRDQYVGFMKGIDHAGKVLALFYGILIIVGILASTVLVGLESARDRARVHTTQNGTVQHMFDSQAQLA